MRDKWFDRIGAMRLNLEERGFLATLYAWGDEFFMPFDQAPDVFGEGWIVVAEELRRKGYVDMKIEDRRVTMSIHHTDQLRRIRNRRNQQRHQNLTLNCQNLTQETTEK